MLWKFWERLHRSSDLSAANVCFWGVGVYCCSAWLSCLQETGLCLQGFDSSILNKGMACGGHSGQQRHNEAFR